ncbi:MAG: T9SS type A sorting domain-containing protein [Bacteroidetes bacterium]|nr:T9SS type A sorting domain-containing protein [Bacteroidota bacterium]
MRKFFPLFILIFMFAALAKAQTPQVEAPIPTGLASAMHPDFAGDVLVANVNPIGPMSGVRAADGNLYAAINDTLLTSNLGLILMKSTNNGSNWSLFGSGITARAKYTQVKLVRAGDSLYCFFSLSGTIARWNPMNGLVTVLSLAPLKNFDVAVSSTNSMYVFYQTNGDTLRRIATIDGGYSWTGAGLISNSGGSPQMTFSTLGDTLIFNYRGPVRADFPEKSIWRSGLYRQSGPGTLGFISLSFTDIILDTTVAHNELKTVKRGLNVWTVFTEGSAGNINLKCLTSTNGGTIYGSAFSVASSPTRDEYWFDLAASTGITFPGVDLIYYSDSLQAGVPTNTSDKMFYSYSGSDNPSSFSAALQFNDVPPISSASNSKPSLVELPAGDFGALFLGYTPGGNKVYWDRFSAITNVTNNGNSIADKFELKQNYPNPFNPTTKISFSIPKSSFVSLKVYDIMGKEVAKLVSGNVESGNYSVQFDGKNLSSGVYFYKLETENFSEVKKMSLIK